TAKLARHWLHGLSRGESSLPWEVIDISTPTTAVEQTTELFERMLVENMHDGVLFVDMNSKILLWNTGAERLTGVSSSAACGRMFLPSLLDLQNSHQGHIADEECPVARAIASGVQSIGRVLIMGRQGHHV